MEQKSEPVEVFINSEFSFKKGRQKTEVYRYGKLWKLFFNDPFIDAVTESIQHSRGNNE